MLCMYGSTSCNRRNSPGSKCTFLTLHGGLAQCPSFSDGTVSGNFLKWGVSGIYVGWRHTLEHTVRLLEITSVSKATLDADIRKQALAASNVQMGSSNACISLSTLDIELSEGPDTGLKAVRCPQNSLPLSQPSKTFLSSTPSHRQENAEGNFALFVSWSSCWRCFCIVCFLKQLWIDDQAVADFLKAVQCFVEHSSELGPKV